MDEFFKKMRKENERALQVDRLNSKHLSEAVGIVNAIITNPIYNNNQKIEVGDVCFTMNFFSDRQETDRTVSREDRDVVINFSFTHKRRLSNILFDLYYRKPLNGKYYHYTKISALSHILKGELKLKPLLSNENDHEFVSFYDDHGLQGYASKNPKSFGWSKEDLMEETFAFCMASKDGLSDKHEDALWRSFADNHQGVRIEFDITTNHPDFRTIFYRDDRFQKVDLPINRINNVLKSLYDRQLFIVGASKIGAFYLPGEYKIENEVRFLVKNHTDEYEFLYPVQNGKLHLPLKSQYADFRINSIKIGSRCVSSPENRTV